jgi:serine/threonine protein kinase
MPATSANPNAAWFVKELTSARVYEPAQLAPYLSEFKATQRNGDAAALANFLVASGLLTRYQADRTLAGAARNLVLGPYTLSEFVGGGSIGEVYQAVGRSDRKRYAVKVLPLRSLWNVKQAKGQVRAFAGLPVHPAIVPFVDVDSAGGSHYLVWPFIEGQSLAARVRDKGPATVHAALQVMTQAAEGLAVCHAHGIAHGLVNPANLLVGTDGQVRILDLGVGAILSENIADDESMLDTLSAAHATAGMIEYCAPETLNSPTLRDPSGDIYSFGCTFYFLLTGQLPFPDGNVVDKVLAHQTSPPPSTRAANPNVPGWLDDLIARLMAKAPSRRPASMDEVVTKLLAGTSEEYLELPESVEVPAAELAGATQEALASLLPPVPQQSIDTPTAMATTANPWAESESIPTRSRLLPPSVSDIDFGDYSPPDETDGHGWSKLRPVYEVPLEPAPAEPETLRDRPTASRLAKVAPTRPVIYTGAASTATPPAAAPQPAPVLPAFSRSWWFRFKSLWKGWRDNPIDIVQLGVFGPNQICPGESVRLQVFGHLPENFDSVYTLSRAFHADSVLLATGYVSIPVPRGANLSLQLKVTNAGVAHSQLQLAWLGQSQPRAFDVHVPWESPAGLTPVTLTVSVNDSPGGEIGFPVHILPRRG